MGAEVNRPGPVARLAKKHPGLEWLFLFIASSAGAFLSLYMPDVLAYATARAFTWGSPVASDFVFAIIVGLLISLYDVANGDEDARLMKFKQRVARFVFVGVGWQSFAERMIAGSLPAQSLALAVFAALVTRVVLNREGLSG